MFETSPSVSETQEASPVQCEDSVWEWTNSVRTPLFWRGYTTEHGLKIVGLSLNKGVYIAECLKCGARRPLNEVSILQARRNGNVPKCRKCYAYSPAKPRVLKPKRVYVKKPPIERATVVESPSVAIDDSDAAFAAAMLDPVNSIHIDSSPPEQPQKAPMLSDNYFKVIDLMAPALRKIDQRTGKLEQTTWFFPFATGDQLSQDRAFADANEQAHALQMQKHPSQTAVFKPARGLSLPIVGDL